MLPVQEPHWKSLVWFSQFERLRDLQSLNVFSTMHLFTQCKKSDLWRHFYKFWCHDWNICGERSPWSDRPFGLATTPPHSHPCWGLHCSSAVGWRSSLVLGWVCFCVRCCMGIGLEVVHLFGVLRVNLDPHAWKWESWKEAIRMPWECT